MKLISCKNFSTAPKYQSVRVKSLDSDHSKTVSGTLLAVVLEVVDEEYCRLGT